MRALRYSPIVPALAGILLAVASCAEPTAPAGPELLEVTRLSASSSTPTLLTCPTNTTSTASGPVGVFGGTVSVGGTAIVIPPGAVLETHTFNVTVPASRLMEVQITAEGHGHFQFLVPVQVTIDYSRCNSNQALGSLSAYYIDDITKALLELMPGSDDKATRRYTFSTDHLSGYAIAN